MGESLFKLGRYNRVFLEIWAQILIWASMLKQWAVGSFFSLKYSRRAHSELWEVFSRGNTPEELTGTHKSSLFFIKTSKWEKWWLWWFRMTNAFILCNLLWKVQKNLAGNRESSFKKGKVCSSLCKDRKVRWWLWQCCAYSPGLIPWLIHPQNCTLK